MKHSIAVKFIAVALCAAFLLGAVGSGVGALCLTEMGLYEQTVDDLYDESRTTLAEVFANQLAQNYVSQTLGGCPEEMTDNYVYFNAGYYGYTVTDSTGTIVKERTLENGPAQWNYTFTVQESYMKLIEAIPESQKYEETVPTSFDDLYIFDNRPGDDVLVDEIEIFHLNGKSYGFVDENLGVLYHTATGDVYFQAHDPMIRLQSGTPVTQASFFSNGKLVYQITCSDGVGVFATDENGLLSVVFQKESAGITISGEDYLVYDALPPEGAEVQGITVEYLNSRSDSCGADGGLGYLRYQDNTLIFVGHDGDFFLSVEGSVSHISFTGTNGELLYEASAEEGGIVGEIFHSASGVQFQSWLPMLYADDTSVDSNEPQTDNPTEEIPRYTDIGLAYNLVNNIPSEGAYVHSVSFTDCTGPSSFGICTVTLDTRTGFLSYNADGAVIFRTTSPSPVKPDGDTFYYVAFYGANNEVIYEASNPEGVGTFYLDEDNYLHFTSTMETVDTPVETTAPTAEETMPIEPGITDNIAKLGPEVSTMLIVDAEGKTHTIDPGEPQDKAFAYLFRNGDGTITCRSYEAMTLIAMPAHSHCVSFLDADGYVLYQVASDECVGSFVTDSNGHMRFVTSVTPEAVTPETEPYVEPTTIPDTTTATEEVQIPVDIPVETTVIAELTDPTEAATVPQTASYAQDDITYTYYYDRELGQNVEASFVYEDMPEPYTVEIRLAKGAYEMDAVYDLLNWIWLYRNELLYVLGISLLGFAVTAVYLCCAAGKKKGREEIRAGGFNCLSLDVYLGAGGLAICALAVLGFEGGAYLLRYSPQILAPFAVIMGYAAALIIVSFCFACAAQFKTPGGYWWHNTLTVRCVRLAVQFLRWSAKLFLRFMGWLERFLGRAFPALGKVIVICWNSFLQFCLTVYRYTEKGLTWLGRGLGKIAQRTYAWLHAFLSLLPVTWQWLLGGFGIICILFIGVCFEAQGFTIAALLVIGIVIYAAHCFGLLLDSTKRMSKGDLETKVDDKLMIGSFKEFASDLNALGDVAVIAAQKQMASDRMKTELITNVSHDIKTPLTSIINYVDLLQKPHTDEEQEAYLEVLSRQSLRMKKLLEDLIEMSKASTGNMTVHITKINAVEAVNQALGEFADKLEKAHLTPMVQHPEEPVYMQADGRLAWRVLSNLLSNAVKYALPGTRVYIDVMELDGKVLISLKNISQEALNVSAEELMERFVRGDTSRNTEGSGLGLNIAQSLMEIQKGKLQLTVDGDLFKVTLLFPSAEE